jgi:glycosyltransferase involved in cell wall biosynthesis
MTDIVSLDEGYSTTRLLTKEKPKIINTPEDKFETVLFLPEGENRKGEGGLRTKGYFKKSFDDKPLISIITVVFNGEKYLEETIKSVINQTYDNVEYIIIDGGSTDGTLDIIKKYEDKIDYWVSEKDRGIYDAMNKGIKLASGEWINFMNAGDGFYDNYVLDKLFTQNNLKDIGILYGNHAVKNENNSEIIQVDVKDYNGKRNIPFCHQSLFVRTSLLKSNLFDLQFKIASDYDQFLRLKSKDIQTLHVPLIISIYLDGGISSISREKLIKEYVMI